MRIALLASETLLEIRTASITYMIYSNKAIEINSLAPQAHSRYLKTCSDQDEGLFSSSKNMQT